MSTEENYAELRADLNELDEKLNTIGSDDTLKEYPAGKHYIVDEEHKVIYYNTLLNHEGKADQTPIEAIANMKVIAARENMPVVSEFDGGIIHVDENTPVQESYKNWKKSYDSYVNGSKAYHLSDDYQKIDKMTVVSEKRGETYTLASDYSDWMAAQKRTSQRIAEIGYPDEYAAGQHYKKDEYRGTVYYDRTCNHNGKKDADIAETIANMKEIAAKENMPVETVFDGDFIRAEPNETAEEILKNMKICRQKMDAAYANYERLTGILLDTHRKYSEFESEVKTIKDKINDIQPVESCPAGSHYLVKNDVIYYNPENNHVGDIDGSIDQAAANMKEIAVKEKKPVVAVFNGSVVRADETTSVDNIVKGWDDYRKEKVKVKEGEGMSFGLSGEKEYALFQEEEKLIQDELQKAGAPNFVIDSKNGVVFYNPKFNADENIYVTIRKMKELTKSTGGLPVIASFNHSLVQTNSYMSVEESYKKWAKYNEERKAAAKVAERAAEKEITAATKSAEKMEQKLATRAGVVASREVAEVTAQATAKKAGIVARGLRKAAAANAAFDRGFDRAVAKASGKLNNSKVGKAYDKKKKAVANSKAGQAVKKVTGKAVKKAAETSAGKAVQKVVTKVVAKTVGTAVGKSVLKKIPLVSLAAGGYFAYERLKKGDWKGACGEAASGLLGCLPGFGTAASTAIDVGLGVRDVSNVMAQGKQPAKTPKQTKSLTACRNPREVARQQARAKQLAQQKAKEKKKLLAQQKAKQGRTLTPQQQAQLRQNGRA